MTNEPLRDVLLDNKQTVYGVPDEITDEEVKDAYAARPEGFNIIVLPHVKAGIIFLITVDKGKFHGVISNATPNGS